MIKIKNENYKNFLIALLGFTLGFVCWYAGTCLFAFGTSKLIPLITNYMKNSGPVPVALSHFFLFNGTNFILIVLFAFVLSCFFGTNKFGVIAFIALPIGYPIFNTILSIVFYNYSIGVPLYLVNYFIQLVVSSVIVSPVLTWLGLKLGNKLYIKRNILEHNQAVQGTTKADSIFSTSFVVQILIFF